MLSPQYQPFCLGPDVLYKLVLGRDQGINVSCKKWFYGNEIVEIDSVCLVASNFSKLASLLFKQYDIEMGLL